MAWYCDVLDEDHDPPKLLIIGPDGAGNLLELVGGVLDDGDLLASCTFLDVLEGAP